MDNQLLRTGEVFGRNLCIQRKNKGLTQLQIAQDLGVHETTILNWKHGSREPNLYSLIKIPQYFDVSIDYLLSNKVTIPEHYITVHEAFPGLLELLYALANDQNKEKLYILLKFIQCL